MENTMSSGAQKMQSGAREVKDAAMDKASQFRDAAMNKANEIKDAAVKTGAEYVQRGADSIKQCCEDTEAMVRTHPFQSLLVAVGVGALVGAILTRR